MIFRWSSLRIWLAALVPLLAVSLFADSDLDADVNDSLPDFSSLSLQELSSIKVTSVSKKQEKLSQVAAAVYVLSQEEIHRSGMTNVADLLRLVPGLSVARIDGSKWGVTSRGFNGRFADNLLVLVDGRSIYSPIFSGVYWDMSMPLLDNIDRIEVIRGPGAAVWGANAVSGVINIITKSANETTGTEVTTSAGSQDRGAIQVQTGGKIGGGIHYRAYADAADFSALQTSDGRSAHDGWDEIQAGFRMDGTYGKTGWQLEGDLFHNNRGEASNLPTPANDFSSNTEYGRGTGNSGDLAFEYRRQISDTSDLRVDAAYDYVNRPEESIAQAKDTSGSIEMQYHFLAGKYNDISLGLGDRVVSESVLGQGLTAFNPSSLEYQTGSAFAQDEVHLLGDRVLLTGGVKIQHDVLGGWQTQPTVRALWAPTQKHSFWVSASRAVRTPTFYERDVDIEVVAIPASTATFGLPIVSAILGSPAYQAEVSKDYEVGYRAQLSPEFSIDLATFYTHYDDQRTASPGALGLVIGAQPYIELPYTLNNFSRGHAEGGEIAFTYHPVSCWKVAASYGYLNVHEVVTSIAPAGTEQGDSNAAPAHQIKLQSYFNLSKSLQIDTHLFYNSAFFSPEYLIGNQLIPEHLRLDARLGWRINPRWEVSVVGQDLASNRHVELTPEVLSPASYVGRDFYVKSTFRF